ncbi:MAG: ribonuclease III [Patescibacteria group bacterium]|nr:ribonuclease III [Patescibacteria group bacterium]
MDAKNLEDLEVKINIEFKDKSLLKNAFIHRSYLNEHPEEKSSHNERLEFLGDAVLAFVVSEYLFKNYPNHPEGDLTNFRASIVCARSLAMVAKDLDLGSYLLLSRGEEATGGRDRQYLLANTFEALLGAIYLDQGTEKANNFVQKYLLPHLSKIIEQELYKDYKSKLQELSQEKLSITPIYKLLSETGPDHSKIFKMGVFLEEKLVAEGEGTSKQSAEQEAAKAALKNWPENP